MEEKEFELMEELTDSLTNLPTLFRHLASTDEDENRVRINLRNAKNILNQVESELKRIYRDYLELRDIFFNCLSDDINKIRHQIDSGIVLCPKERREILDNLSEIILEVFKKPIINFQDKAVKGILSDNQLTILFDELKGAFEPYKQDHFNYAFNGGEKPNEYKGLKKTERFKDVQWVYLLSELYTNGVTDWSVAKELDIKNPEQKKVNYGNNSKDNNPGKPKGYEKIDNIIAKVKNE